MRIDPPVSVPMAATAMAEYLEPHRRFRTEKIRDTVVFFGSARIRSREASEQQLEAARLGEGILASQQADAIATAEHAVQWSRYYEDARELAHNLTRWSRALAGPCHRFVVCSGGGPGIMVNDTSIFRVDQMPYGGNRMSGVGREGVRFAIEEMTNLKLVCFNLE